MFKVHIKIPEVSPPNDATYYIVAKNGIFLKKESWWAKAIVPVRQIAVLDTQETAIELKLPAISSVVMTKVWAFFKAVYKKHGSEAAVLIHYSPELGWNLTVPKQVVSYSHVDYEMTDRIDGYVFVGTMHSHSSMSAFHSGTDVRDEAQVDGIHITLGNMNYPDRFSMDAEAVVNGTRMALPLNFLDGVTKIVEEQSKIGRWVGETLLGKNDRDYDRRYGYGYDYNRSYDSPQMHTISDAQQVLSDGWEIPNEWMEKVSKRGWYDFGGRSRDDRRTIIIDNKQVNDPDASGDTTDMEYFERWRRPAFADENPAGGKENPATDNKTIKKDTGGKTPPKNEEVKP